MKKYILIPLFFVLLACSQEDSKLNESDEQLENELKISNNDENIIQKFYKFNNRKYSVDFLLEGNSAEPIKGQKDYKFIKSILDKPETAVYFNSKTSERIIFETENDLKDYLKEEKNHSKNTKNNIETKQQMTGPLTVYKDGTYSGESITLSTSVPDLRTIGFDDNISSLQTAALPTGRQISLHEHPNYNGKRIIIEPRGVNVNLACLCDFKIGSSGPSTIYIVGGAGVDPGSICGWFCNSWNDETTSISFSPFFE